MNSQYISDVVGEELPSSTIPDNNLIIIDEPDISESSFYNEELISEIGVSSDSSGILNSIDSSLLAIESLMFVIVVCILIFFTSRVLSIFFKNI